MQDANFEDIQNDAEKPANRNIWMRGLTSILFMILFSIANSLLGILTVVQFFWMLLTGERNVALMDFGASIGRWMSQVADFQAARTEERPFPWAPWPAE